MGVSRQCAHRWVARFDAEGMAGLQDRSSRPHHMPTKTRPEVEARVLAARAKHRRGQDWIGPELGVAPRTVSRILRRHKVPLLAVCDPLTGKVIRASKTTAVRYERSRPGELVHMDVKKIGRIPDGGGWRAHGRQMGSTAAKRRTRIGFGYVHSSSMTTAASPTPRYSPTRRRRPAPPSSFEPPPTSPPMASLRSTLS
jgi:hypothetical protein